MVNNQQPERRIRNQNVFISVRRILLFCSTLISSLLLFPVNVSALSLSVDFGSGSFTVYSSSVPSITGVCVSNCGGPLGLPTAQHLEEDRRRMRAFEEKRLEEQKKEAAERKRAEERKQRIQREDRSEELDRDSEKEFLEHSELTQRIITIVSVFDKEQTKERIRIAQLMQKLSDSIAQIHVPPPPLPQAYDSVLFLGTGNSTQDAEEALRANATNPFTHKPYEQIFAFGEHGATVDIGRSALDHLRADRALLSSQTLQRVPFLRGTAIKTIVAHSNGATVAEVLIRNGVIKGVKEFYILGGDRSLMNIESLHLLATKYGIKVFIYANGGDIVPLIQTGWQIREMAEKVGPVQQYEIAKNLTYQVMGLQRAEATQQLGVKVQLLSTPFGWHVLKNHEYQNYHRIIESRECCKASLE